MAMVLRLYDPLGGSVTLDGEALTEINLGWLRERIAVVEQSTTLFSGTIRENIALGKPDATYEEIVQAAKLAHAHDFISSFPAGYVCCDHDPWAFRQVWICNFVLRVCCERMPFTISSRSSCCIQYASLIADTTLRLETAVLN